MLPRHFSTRPLKYFDPSGNLYEDVNGNWQLNEWDYQWNFNYGCYNYWLNDWFFKENWWEDSKKLASAGAFLTSFDFGRENWIRDGGYFISVQESRRIQTIQAAMGIDVTGWYDD